jgi:putative transposase
VGTGEARLYLATVIDLFSGMVISWATAEHTRASLCTAALRMARNHSHVAEHSVVFQPQTGPTNRHFKQHEGYAPGPGPRWS